MGEKDTPFGVPEPPAYPDGDPFPDGPPAPPIVAGVPYVPPPEEQGSPFAPPPEDVAAVGAGVPGWPGDQAAAPPVAQQPAPYTGSVVPGPVVPGRAARARRIVWAAIIASVLVLCACPLVAYFAFDALQGPLEDLTGLSAYYYGPRGATWTADGSFVLVQDTLDGTTPAMIAVDALTGESRIAPGYVLASIEPSGAAAWLVPAKARSAEDWLASSYNAGIPESPYDLPGSGLAYWDLSSADSTPTPAASARRAPSRDVAPSTGWWAVYEPDPKRGAGFARVFLGGPSFDDPVAVELPADIVTFRTLGFSPSGRYLAIEELWPDRYREHPPADGLPERRLLVIDVATRGVSAEGSLGISASQAPEWTGYSDDLVWIAEIWPTELDEPARTEVRVLDAASGTTGTFTATGLPGELQSYETRLLGSGPSGLLLSDSTSLYLIGPEGATNTGTSAWGYGADWREGSGLANLESSWNTETSAEESVLAVYDVHGGARRELWRSPARD